MSESFIRFDKPRLVTAISLAALPSFVVLQGAPVGALHPAASGGPIPSRTTIKAKGLAADRPFGAPVEVKVHARGGRPSDGNVSVMNEATGAVLCSVPVVNGAAPVPGPCLPPGTVGPIVASFDGGSSWAPSTSAPSAPFSVGPGNVALTLTSVQKGAAPEVTIRLGTSRHSAPDMPVPTGTVVFQVPGIPDSPRLVLNADGFTTPIDAVFKKGRYTVTVEYFGDGSYGVSDSIQFKLHGSDFNAAKNANNGEGWQFPDS